MYDHNFTFLFIYQANQPQKVDREAYSGSVVEIKAEDAANLNKAPENPIIPPENSPAFHQQRTSGGVRNMQDSSFSLSGQCYIIKCISNNSTWFT